MVTIDAAGGYVPLYRIQREDVASQHGGSASGETAVPGRDENLITMASEAAGTALARANENTDTDDLAAVYAASVTDPFAEHGVAAHVAYRHGATGDVRTGDFRATSRAATDALAAAGDRVEVTGDPVLVVAADVMPVEAGHDDEPYSGAAAGALVLSPDDGAGDHDDPAARIHGIGQATTGFVERHREHGQPAEAGDRRYAGEAGFGGSVPEAVEAALATAPAMPEAAVVQAPDQRTAAGAVGEFPGDVEHVSTFDGVGYAGAASFYLDLAHLLETAAPDETALAVSYGAGGADAVALTAGGMADAGELTVEEQLEAKEHVTYADHLDYRTGPDYVGVVR